MEKIFQVRNINELKDLVHVLWMSKFFSLFFQLIFVMKIWLMIIKFFHNLDRMSLFMYKLLCSSSDTQNVKFESALGFLEQVKRQLAAEPHTYKEFLRIMKELKGQE